MTQKERNDRRLAEHQQKVQAYYNGQNKLRKVLKLNPIAHAIKQTIAEGGYK